MMNKIALSTTLKVLACFWLIPLLFSVVGSLGGNNTSSNSNLQDYQVPEISIAEQKKVNNETLIALFDTLLPDRKKINQDSIEEETQVAKEKVIDKTLLPNFSNFDDQHQISLAGIFKERDIFAVVQLINYETRASEFRKLELNNQIGDFELTAIFENKIELTSGTSQIHLELFKQDS